MKNEENIDNEKIVEACIYSDRAIITREVNIAGVKGESKYVFKDIPISVQEDSIRVKAKGNVVLLDNNVKEIFFEETNIEKLNKLQAQLVDIDIELSKNTFEEEKYKKLTAFFNSILNSEDALEDTNLSNYDVAGIENYQQLIDYYSSEKENIIEKVVPLRTKRRELEKKKSKITLEMNKLRSSASRQVYTCEVNFLKNDESNAKLIISYLSVNASWSPLYDARLAYKEREFELIRYADVIQNTGEEWKDISLSLSTANPVLSAYLPEPQTWFIKFYVPPSKPRMSSGGRYKKKAKIKSEEKAKLDREEEIMDGFAGDIPEPCCEMEASIADEKEAAEITQETFSTSEVKSTGVNVTFTCKSSQDIPSEGSSKKVLVSMEKFPVEYEYVIMPAIEEAAYLKIIVKNDKDYPIVKGPVKVFRDFDFVGDSNIKTIVPNEELELYLGVDDNVKVERELVNEFSSKKGLGGKDIKKEYKYKLTIESFKDEVENIKVFEQLPVSMNKDIEVKFEEQSEFSDPDEKGIIEMELEIKPKEKKEFIYGFSVRYPAEESVYGLP